MKDKSVVFCYFMTYLWLGVMAALLIFAPRVLSAYMEFRALPWEIYQVILIDFYLCCIPAAVALLCLLRILGNIRRQQMFDRVNEKLLRVVSWCSLAVAILTLAGGFWYFPLFFITAAMLFIFLIVRVVCTLLAAGAALEEESSLTI